MTETQRITRLQRPQGPVEMVLDTDAFNEIDDQFAIAYMLRAPEKLRVEAVYAAPFSNAKAATPGEGMEKSYQEILHITRLAGVDMGERVYAGSRAYLPDEATPVDSPAARDLVARARAHTPENPLYVVAIGAVTNVASALLIDPTIAETMVLIWLGGHARHWLDNREFNLRQDIAGARVVFGCGVPLVQLPCMGVVDALRTTEYELRHWLQGRGPLCDYLVENTVAEANSYAAGRPWSRVIWDVAAVGWLLDEKEERVQDLLLHSPIPEYDGRWAYDDTRPFYKYVHRVNRDALLEDLFRRLGD